MHSALQPIIRAALYFLLSVLAIALVLVVGKELLDGLKGAACARERLGLLVAVDQQVDRYRQDQAERVEARLDEARGLPLAAVDKRIRAVSTELARDRAAEAGELVLLLEAGPEQYAARLAARYQDGLAHALLLQELAYLQQVRAHLFALQSRQAAQDERGRLLARHRAVYARLLQKREELARLGWIDARRIE